MTTIRRAGCCLMVLLLATPAWAQQGLRWETDLDAARASAAQTNRLVLVHFSASWCGPCQKLEQNVFSQPGFGQTLSGQYVAVKLNFDEQQALATQWGVEKIPTDVVITPQGQLVQKFVSPQTAEQYVGALQQIAAAAGYRGQPVLQQIAQQPDMPAPATAQVPPSAGPPNNAGLSDDRYADYFTSRGGPSAAPTAQPYPPQPYAPQPTAQPVTPQVNAGPYAPPPAVAPSTPPASPYGDLVTTPQPSAPVVPPAPVGPPEQRHSMMYAGINPGPGATPSAAPQVPSPPPASGITAPPSGNPPMGLEGFCPVTLVQQKQWIKGDTRSGAIHRGRTYLFTSPEAQQQFLANPDSFSPTMSGDDPVLALDHNQAIPGRRQHGVFYGGRIFLFSSEASLDVFSKNPGRYAAEVQQARR